MPIFKTMHEFYTGGLGTVVGSDCPKVAAMYQIVHLLTAGPKASVTLNVGNEMRENQISAEVRFSRASELRDRIH